LLKPQAAFSQADIASLADDQVVKDLYIEHLAGLNDLARHQHIFNIYMENHLTV